MTEPRSVKKQIPINGMHYAEGQGVATNYVEAVQWFRKAAEQNHAKAQCWLGVCYQNGLGVVTDDAEAVNWYHKAAKQNDTSAEFNLACCYDRGRGVAKDEAEAVKWLCKAAKQHSAVAQRYLGFCYANGQGVATNHVEAVRWYRKAAQQSLADAQIDLGCCYQDGQGVAKDEVKAVKWFRKAAEQNDTWGQNALAWILATSANPAIRDGSNAVVFAEGAVAATDRKIPTNLDTLAAAYAEVGQFEKAVSVQNEAIALLDDEKSKKDFPSRLKLYEAKTPYRDTE